MAGSCGTGGPAAGWKRHIVRQLRQRDRTQKALFLELVPAYNRLLEKAELLARFSEKVQPEPNDVTPATHQDPWEESGPDSDQVPSPATLRVKWQEEEEELQLDCGEPPRLCLLTLGPVSSPAFASAQTLLLSCILDLTSKVRLTIAP
uniref:Autophagy related 16 like 2 n=1 Tax=Rhinolophus ferrumequinum TaxID=59479 RepID=A0A671FFE7_RHIFE